MRRERCDAGKKAALPVSTARWAITCADIEGKMSLTRAQAQPALVSDYETFE